MRRTPAQRIHSLSTDCELMRLRTSARLDGELSEADQAELAGHLDRCDACARFAHGLAGWTEVLRSDCLRGLLLLGVLAIILGGGKSTGNNNHARCHSVWGVATVCGGRV